MSAMPARMWVAAACRRARSAWAIAGLCGILAHAAVAEPLTDARYAFGRGLELPALNLAFSGYASLRVRDLQDEDAHLDLRDLSMMIRWQPSPRWQVFSELELENTLVIDDRGWSHGDIEGAVERAYIEYAAAPTLSVRAGRYLTPFGRWNELHADPLVWTVSRPLVTSLIIADHASGLDALGTFDVAHDTVDYHLYLDDSRDLDPVHGEASFEDFTHAGLYNDLDYAGGAQFRLHCDDDRAEIALSYATFKLYRTRGQFHAVGIDALWRWQGFEFTGEAAYRTNDGLYSGDDWGAFAQAVVPLVGQWYGVSRLEYYRSGILDLGSRRFSIGAAYRPLPPLNFKFEYHDGTDRRLTPDGFEVSLSVLF